MHSVLSSSSNVLTRFFWDHNMCPRFWKRLTLILPTFSPSSQSNSSSYRTSILLRALIFRKHSSNGQPSMFPSILLPSSIPSVRSLQMFLWILPNQCIWDPKLAATRSQTRLLFFLLRASLKLRLQKWVCGLFLVNWTPGESSCSGALQWFSDSGGGRERRGRQWPRKRNAEIKLKYEYL